MSKNDLEIEFKTTSVESARALLSLCEHSQIDDEAVIARPPGRKGHQFDLNEFDVLFQVVSVIPWETVIELILGYVVSILVGWFENRKSDDVVTVVVEGEEFRCRSEQDVAVVQGAIRRHLLAIRDMD